MSEIFHKEMVNEEPAVQVTITRSHVTAQPQTMSALVPVLCSPGSAETERLSALATIVIHNHGITALYRTIVVFSF